MKKTLNFFILFLLISLTACSNGSVTDNSGEQTTETNQSETANNEKGGRDFRMPDFGQPEEKSDINGLITKIVGNQVTVLKIERPEGSGEGMGMMKMEEGAEEGEDEAAKIIFGNMGGGMPGGGPGMGGGPGRMDEDGENDMAEMLKEMGSEEETITVPVGIKMLKFSDDAEDMEAIEASLSDLEVDQMINIWLNDKVEDQSVASFVFITR